MKLLLEVDLSFGIWSGHARKVALIKLLALVLAGVTVAEVKVDAASAA